MKRTLTPYNYLQTLQKEYLICRLRIAIYNNAKDVDYQLRTAELKKQRILDVAKTHNFRTIFDSEELKENMLRTFMGKGGIPLFQGLNNKDIYSYYSEFGSGVCFKVRDQKGIWVVMKVERRLGKVELKRLASGTVEQFPFSQVERIWKEKIF